MKNVLMLALLLGLNFEGFGQFNVDSVKKIYVSSSEDSTKIKECTVVSNIFYKQGYNDSAKKYALKTLELYSGKTEALPFEKRKLATKYFAYANNTLGLIAATEAKYPAALGYYYKALEASKQYGDQGTQARCLGNIGIVFTNTGDYRKALEYFDKAEKIHESIGSEMGIAMVTLNKGICFTALKDSLQALHNYEKALAIAKKINHLPMAATCLGNIGTFYGDHKLYQKAVPYFKEALDLSLKFDSPENIARNYRNLGLLYADTKEFNLSFNYLYRSLVISDSIKNLQGSAASYDYLSHLYEISDTPLLDTLNGKTLNIEKMRMRAVYYLRRHLQLQLQIINEENTKATFEKEAKFQFEQKEALANAARDKERSLEEANNRRNLIVLFSVLVILGVVAFFTFMVWKNLRITKAQKKIIEQQKHEVDEKQKEILDSIRYAKRIQVALMPSEKNFSRSLKLSGNQKPN